LFSGELSEDQQAIVLRRLESKEKREDTQIAKQIKTADRAIKNTKEVFDKEDKLRDEFVKASGAFVDQRDALGRIQASIVNPDAAGDLALVFNFFKLLDPASTVREGEFNSAAKAAGLGERFLTAIAKVKTGEILGKTQRELFLYFTFWIFWIRNATLN